MRTLVFITLTLSAIGQPRTLDTVVPSLDYGPACTSTVEAVNLTDREVTAEIQAHRESGALVLLRGQSSTSVRIPPRARISFQFEESERGAGWVRIAEPAGAPALAISGMVECVDGDRLVSASREVTYPMRSPWFSGETAGLSGAVVTAINVSGQPARIAACYSEGNLVSDGQPDLVPLCSSTVDLIIPPFATQRIPVGKDGNSWFSMKTSGVSIVLAMLRPVAPRVHLYRVDSTIQFE